VAIGLQLGALFGGRCIEVRALLAERHAVEPADVQTSRRVEGEDLELLTRSLPACKRAVVELGDLLAQRGNEIAVELVVVILDNLELSADLGRADAGQLDRIGPGTTADGYPCAAN